jgi:VWFA-related protein
MGRDDAAVEQRMNSGGAMSLRYWAVPLVICLTSVAFAQQTAAPAAQQEQSRPELSHRLAPNPHAPQGKIRMDVLVTDASGHPVGGLTQQDFTLLDDKKPQPILSFQAVNGSAGAAIESDPPVEVILLIDGSNARLTNVAYERYQIDRFLKQNGGRLAQPTTLMIYSDRGVQTQAEPTTDGNAVAQAFDQAAATTHTFALAGGYNAIERMNDSIRTLQRIAAVEAQKPGRKILLWIGQGWPMLAGPGFQGSYQTQKIGFNAVVEISHALREARITLYNINAADPGSSMLSRDLYKDFLKPVKSPRDFQSGADLSVPVFAVHSGGRVLNSTGDLAALINSCVAEAEPYYVVGFDPASAEHTDEYHALDIKVGKPGLTARTSAGYYAEPGVKP